MADVETSPNTGRRLFISMGVGNYRFAPSLRRPVEDAELMAVMLADFGYQPAPFRFGDYSSASHVRDVLGNWCADAALGADDVVVLYFAGHGVVEDADRHYLLCWDSNPRSLAATALATEDVVRILTRTGLGNLLVVLDTCYGGSGAADGAQLVLRTVARGISGSTTQGGVWFLSAARSEDAIDGAFALTVRRALDQVGGRTGQRQRFLDLTDIVTELNNSFERLELPQRAALANGLITGVAPFFANAGFAAHLPEGDTDLEQQRRLAKRDLDEHFDPRSRGVAYPTEIGFYFHGRERLRAELVDWILADNADGKTRVVTGSPGCGKSAVLGRVVAMSDADYRTREPTAVFGPEARIPTGWVDVAVHARHKGIEQIVAQIAQTLGIRAEGSADLLRKLGERARRAGKLVVVVDALDEAGSGTAADAGGKGEPRRIARQFLRPLAEVPNIRLLVGTRKELLDSLGSAHVLDLDHTRYRRSQDIPEYVAEVLLSQRQPEISTSYRALPELARMVGEAVADRAAGNFLVARMAARTLRSADKPVDTTLPGWKDRMPSGIGEALEDDLDRFGPDKDRAKNLLAPLAFAEGQGLPRGPLWIGIAAGLSGQRFGEDDLAWLLDTAGSYLVEATEGGRSVYRLYHLALAEYLRDSLRCSKAIAQRHIVEVLVDSVPRRADETPDWFTAHDYVRRHLATHAAASGQLDELVIDPGFLLVADQRTLLRALPAVDGPAARQARVAYEQVVHHLADPVPVGERGAYLELSARRCGAAALADRIDDLRLTMPWRTSWAWWSPSGVHRQLAGHTKPVRTVASGDLDGRPVALTGSADGTARIWDLIEHHQLGDPLPHGKVAVTAVAIVETSQYSIGVTGDDEGRLHVWDLSTGQRLRDHPLTGHTHEINDIAVDELDGRTITVSASADGTVRVWDLTNGTQLGDPLGGHRGAVNAVAVGQFDDRPILVTGGADNRVRVWDLERRQQLYGVLTGHADQINSVALGALDGRPVVVTGSRDNTMGVWDLATRHLVGEPVYAHWRGVVAVATGAMGTEHIAVTGGQEGARVWNLRTRQQIGQPLSGHSGRISAVSVTGVEGRPIAITTGYDSTVRVWDLTADQPLSGHTRDVLSIDAAVVGQQALAITGSEDTTAIVWDLEAGGTQLGEPFTGHEGPVSAVALTELRGNPIAATGSADTTVRIWDLQRRRAMQEFAGHTGPVMALAAFEIDDLPLLATGSRDGTVRVWQLETGREHCPPLVGHNADVDLLATGRFEGRTLVIAARKDGRTSSWTLPSAQPFPLGPVYPEDCGAYAVGFLRGRPIALIARQDNALQLWDLVSGTPMGQPLVGHTNGVTQGALSVNDEHALAATGDYDGHVRLWDLRANQPVGVPLTGHDFRLNALTLVRHAGRRSLLSANGGVVRLWQLETSQQEGDALTGHQSNILALAFAERNGQHVVLSGGGDGMLRIHALSTGKLAGPVLNGHRGFIFGLACVDSDEPLAVSVGLDDTLRVWDLATHRQRIRLDLPRSSYPPTLAVGHRSDGIVAAVGIGANIQVWSLASRALLGELDGHTADVCAAVICEDTGVPTLLTGSRDSTARLWNLKELHPTGVPWKGHDGAVTGVALAVINGRLVGFTGDGDGVVRMWDASNGSQLPCTISKAETLISAMTAGRIHKHTVLVIGSTDGLCRLFCLESNRAVAQFHLAATVNDIVITEDASSVSRPRWASSAHTSNHGPPALDNDHLPGPKALESDQPALSCSFVDLFTDEESATVRNAARRRGTKSATTHRVAYQKSGLGR